MDDMIMGFIATIRFEIVTGSRFSPFRICFIPPMTAASVPKELS